jgi:[protein-PII] uridylyltransferase
MAKGRMTGEARAVTYVSCPTRPEPRLAHSVGHSDSAGSLDSILPRLPEPIPCAGVSEAARSALRQMLGDGDRRLAEAFHAGVDVRALLAARAALVDRLVTHVYRACVGEWPDLALFAVGGYGRGELFPHSDIDLLALSATPPAPAACRALEAFFTCLWDVGLKPGHAVRTVADGRALAAQDLTIFTSLLDARRLAGAPAIAVRLDELQKATELWPPSAFLAAKIADRQARHARFDDTAYNLEPNLKDGPGGLRELHLIDWLGRRLFAAPNLEALVGCGVLSAAEAAAAAEARLRLMRIRYALHLAAGRAEERLLFDYQRTLAAEFGYRDEHDRNLAVEQFMQDYYRAALSAERLCEQFVQRCEEALESSGAPRERLSLDFIAVDGRLDCDPPEQLLRRPAALIDLFRVWVEHPRLRGLRADLVRRIENALAVHGATLAANAEVNDAFLRLLRKGAPAVEALARMHHYGVLARYLPAFGRVVGRMQYDLFHVYTVDEHTLRVLRQLARCAEIDDARVFSHGHEVWQRLAKPELLLLAALFHDLAKGRGGDHCELGEAEARAFCQRLGLSQTDTDLVAWLVRHHLLMSTTAQRQDITDPEVVHRFAVAVADWERLDYLYLLTVADISGTSAKLWNAWKDKLLSELYVRARYVLRAGCEQPPHAAERVRECQARARELLVGQGVAAATVVRIWDEFPEELFLRFTPTQIAWQTAGIARAAGRGGPLVLIEPQGPRGGSEVFVYAVDGDGLFATATAVLDRLRVSVHDARIVTSANGMSLDHFLVLDAESGTPIDPGRGERLRLALTAALARKPYRVEPVRRAPSRVQRHFPIATRIQFDTGAGGRTQLALVCADRPGLLASVAQALRECGVRVHEARIATFGERVEDFFLLSDEQDQPLAPAICDALRAALLARLEADSTRWSNDAHGSA